MRWETFLGGNSFDMLFLAAADIAYREGSLCQAIGERQLLLVGIVLLMKYRSRTWPVKKEKKRYRQYQLESFTLLLLYSGTLFVLVR